MITKECFGCEKVTSHEHLHDCAPGIPETHIVGSERFVCVVQACHVRRQRWRVAFPFHIRQSGGGTMSHWNLKRAARLDT
jgi:hypothetical protein